MWKYVSRRFKESFEKTYNVLDIKRSWICSNGNQNSSVLENDNDNKVYYCVLDKNFCKNNNARKFGSSSDDEEKFKEKVKAEHGYLNNTLIGALTWSSAIICGWYTSQLMCFHRRQLGWETKCYYSKYLYNPSRAIHQNVLSHRAFNAPPISSSWAKQNINYYEEKFPETEDIELRNVINIHNDNNKIEVIQDKEKEFKTIESAVNNLLYVLGDIEFQLGVQNIKVGNYKTAVSHLKLATTHNHAGATFNLGLCYEHGLGVEQDFKSALECYQIASSMGHAKAMYNLGIFYIQGLGGLKKNRKSARACFNAAANLGLIEAKQALGMQETRFTYKNSLTEGSDKVFKIKDSAINVKPISCT